MSKKMLAVGIALLIYMLGIVSGMILFHILLKRNFFDKYRKPKFERIFERFTKELGLDDQQSKKLKEIFEENRKEISNARDQFETKIKDIKHRMDQEINLILNDKQKIAFEKILRKKSLRQKKELKSKFRKSLW